MLRDSVNLPCNRFPFLYSYIVIQISGSVIFYITLAKVLGRRQVLLIKILVIRGTLSRYFSITSKN